MGAYESNLKPLKVIQNTILKIVFHKDRRYPTRQLYDEGVCNIAGLYVCVVCSFIHRNDNLKQFVKHQYDTRAKVGRSLVIPKNNKAINMKFFDYLAPKLYNQLPIEIRDIPSIKLSNKKM